MSSERRNRIKGSRDDTWSTRIGHEDSPTCWTRAETHSYLASGLAKERLSHLDVARHSDLLVAPERIPEQRSRRFAITSGGAIQQHHSMKAADFSLSEQWGSDSDSSSILSIENRAVPLHAALLLCSSKKIP